MSAWICGSGPRWSMSGTSSTPSSGPAFGRSPRAATTCRPVFPPPDHLAPALRLIFLVRSTAAGNSGGAFDAAQQVKAEERLGIALDRVAHGGVPAAAALHLMTPRDRMGGAPASARISRFIWP